MQAVMRPVAARCVLVAVSHDDATSRVKKTPPIPPSPDFDVMR
jgi:hypothetical protein